MENFLQGYIMAVREGLEAFLIIMVFLQWFRKTGYHTYIPYVYGGVSLGIGVSLLFGGILWKTTEIFETESAAALWESITSIIAVICIVFFIIFMIKHSTNMKQYIEKQTQIHISKLGILGCTTMMIAREGGEISLFSFAGKYQLLSILCGILTAFLIILLISYSLIHIRLSPFLNITLLYLIIQAGFLAGYSVHEFLESIEYFGIIADNSWLLTQAFDLSNTLLDHKTGSIGIPLFIIAGWYDHPQWLQLFVQLSVVGSLCIYWKKFQDRDSCNFSR